jgi:hypothetical protein
MIDDKATKERFGYLGTSLSPKSGRRIVYICSGCGKDKETQRATYKQDHVCWQCARSKKKIGQEAITKDILRVTKLLGHQPTSSEYRVQPRYV